MACLCIGSWRRELYSSAGIASNAHFFALASQKPLAAKPTIGDLAPFEDTRAFLGCYSLAFEFNGWYLRGALNLEQ